MLYDDDIRKLADEMDRRRAKKENGLEAVGGQIGGAIGLVFAILLLKLCGAF